MFNSSRTIWAEVANLFEVLNRQLDALDVFPSIQSAGGSKSHSIRMFTDTSGKLTLEAMENSSKPGEPLGAPKKLKLILNLSNKSAQEGFGSYELTAPSGDVSKGDLTVQKLYGAEGIDEPFKKLWAIALRSIHSNPEVTRKLGHNASQKIQLESSQTEQLDEKPASTEVAAAQEEFRKFTIRCQDRADVAFHGKVLAQTESEWYNGRRKAYLVFQTKGGKYVFLKTGQSARLGESVRNEVSHSAELKDAIKFFGLDALAKALYEKLGINPVEELD